MTETREGEMEGTIYRLTGNQGSAPRDVVVAAIEEGAAGILADAGTLPDAFFDLSTRYAGELLHEISKYGMALAAVVPDIAVHSPRFQEFAAEANTRREIHFFRDAASAEAWLAERVSSR